MKECNVCLGALLALSVLRELCLLCSQYGNTNHREIMQYIYIYLLYIYIYL